jgi:hypothetical protein
MISERAFAASFNDFWQDLFPMLTPALVHLIHSGHQQYVTDYMGTELPEVESRKATRDSAIVSEFAYHLFERSVVNSIPLPEAMNSSDILASAQVRAVEAVNTYEGRIIFSEPVLNADELGEGYELALRYDAFVRQVGADSQVTIPLPLRGAGFLGACNADMLLGDYLVEIKTVKRNLLSKDIRQLVVYLALNAAGGNPDWKFAGFFNPRRSTFHKLVSADLIVHMSGGRPPVDVFSQLIEFACSSDVFLDSTF